MIGELLEISRRIEALESERDALKASVETLQAELVRYANAIDEIYRHNEAARAAVVMHFGTLHPAWVVALQEASNR